MVDFDEICPGMGRLSGLEKRDADKPHGWIQHKGTDICLDVHCACGELTHFDGDFCYYLQCGKCGRKYVVGQTIMLLELTDEEAEKVDADRLKVSEC